MVPVNGFRISLMCIVAAALGSSVGVAPAWSASASSHPRPPASLEGTAPGQQAADATPQQAVDATPQPAPLSDAHREWLEKNVAYIISPREEEVFEQLSSDEERELFIEAFWRERDPTPGTMRNEAREEHERRVEYANRNLGRETPREGWQTDRGRVYIQLGEPRDIGRHYDPKGFWPMELWTYDVNPRATGLPPFFYVLFFRPEMNGEYVIYNPFIDGPGRLAKQISLQMAEPRQVVRTLLQDVGYEVAHASLSLNASERPDFRSGTASLTNETLLASIAAAPFKGIDTGYTQVFLTHRGEVDASVAFGTMPVGLAAMSFWDQSGMPYLHYAVQIPPERVMLAEYESDYYLSLGLDVEIADLRGERIESGGETLEEHFDEQRAQALIRAPLAYYDRLALVPGVYEIAVELVNRVNDEGALARRRMSVAAAPTDEVVLGDLLVATTTRRAADTAQRAFHFEGWQYVPATSGRINAGGEMHLFAQLIAGFAAQPGDVIEVTGELIDAAGTAVETISSAPVTPRPAPTPTALTATIPLAGVAPGSYTARLTARLPGDRLLTREHPIEVVAAGTQPDPMVLLAGEAPPSETRELQARGRQHLRKGETTAALAYFRAGLDLDPGNVGLRRALAQTLHDTGDHAEAARVISPLARSASATSGDALLLSIALREAGEPAGAAQTARALLSRWRPTPAAHNALGDALLALGEETEAAQAFRDSLALDPEQPEIREKLARISGGSVDRRRR